MAERYREIAGIRIGHARARPTSTTHVSGTRRGNARGNYEDSPGHLANERSTSRRSTGINPDRRDPILAGMPNLSPG